MSTIVQHEDAHEVEHDVEHEVKHEVEHEDEHEGEDGDAEGDAELDGEDEEEEEADAEAGAATEEGRHLKSPIHHYTASGPDKTTISALLKKQLCVPDPFLKKVAPGAAPARFLQN